MKTLFKVSLVLAIIFAIASCSNNKNAHLKVIPQNADAVFAINAYELAKKAELHDNSDWKFIVDNFDSEEYDKLSQASKDLLSKIEENPSESGIDYKLPMHIFIVNTNSVYLLFRATDENKIENLLNTFLEEVDNLEFEAIQVEQGYKYANIEGTQIAFNNNALLIGQSTDEQKISKEDMQKLLLNKDNSILDNTAFKKMQSLNGEIHAYANYSSSQELLKNYKHLFAMQPNSLKPYPNVFYYGNVAFENGKIEFTSHIHSENEEYDELMKQMIPISPELQTAHMTLYPKSSIFYTALSLKGKEFYENEFVQELLELDESAKQALTSVEEAIKAIDGDISLGLLSVEKNMPNVLMYANVNNTDFLNSIIYNDNIKNQVVKESDNKYRLDIGYAGVSIYFGVHQDKLFYLTNSKLVYDNIGNDLPSSLKDKNLSINPLDNSFYTLISVEDILQIPIVQGMVNEDADLSKFLNGIVAAEIASENNNSSSIMRIRFKNEEENSLKQTADFLLSTAKKEMQ